MDSHLQHMNPIPKDKALSLTLKATCFRARRSVLLLPHGPVETPVFMAVGTHGTIKGLTPEEVSSIGYQIILGNTYHLANRPGCEVLKAVDGLHNFESWPRNLLTDSGGFQMVSLLKLAKITEEGVAFRSPVDDTQLMLTPEKSIETQNVIGADIIMALDDVVSAVEPDKCRVKEAAERTTRWLDRCIGAHQRPTEQNLFGIVQGGLHSDLRRSSMDDLIKRDLPGYAIGGLSGGEAKADFWKVVELVRPSCLFVGGCVLTELACTRPGQGLPENKPRYLMGVGYPLDLVVCVALGVDMFDCVYPTRTARFGTALVPHGTMRLKLKQYKNDFRPIQQGCRCVACKTYTRAFFHSIVAKESTASRLLTIHNLTYMFDLCREMREAIAENLFPEFVRNFLRHQFRSALIEKTSTKSHSSSDVIEWDDTPPTVPCSVSSVMALDKIDNNTSVTNTACRNELVSKKSETLNEATKDWLNETEVAPCPPIWVRDALLAADIDIREMYHWEKAQTDDRCGLIPHDEKRTNNEPNTSKRSRVTAGLDDEKGYKSKKQKVKERCNRELLEASLHQGLS